MTAIAIAGAGWWATYMADRLKTMEGDLKGVQAISGARAERIAIVEAYVSETTRRLDRMENKIDQLLDRSQN